jgi:hypothetical protein
MSIRSFLRLARFVLYSLCLYQTQLNAHSQGMVTLSPDAQRIAAADPTAALRLVRTRLTAPREEQIPGCALPPGGIAGTTNPHYYFLSEIGGCAKLACFLKQVNTTANAFATLIVDQSCTAANAIKQTLVMPDRFTLAGVGIDGTGVLAFDLPDNVPAIRFANAADAAIRMSTIRDLNLAGGCCNQVGIDVSHSQFVYIKNVRLQSFAIGLTGNTAFSVFVDQSSLHDNAYNIVMGDDTTSWRVRDTGTSRGLLGVHIGPTARGHLVSGGRIESNWGPGVRIDGWGNVIENTWFEGNGAFFSTLYGVWLTGQAQKNRVLSNVFSSQIIGDGGVETHKCFNMSFAANSADVNAC